MNRHLRVQTVVASFVVGASIFANAAIAANRCEQPTVGGEARACAASRNGPEALRRFIERTRTIYGLYYYDYRSEPAAATQQDVTLPSQISNTGMEAASVQSPR